MSAIAGIWRLDGRPVGVRDVHAMAATMAHRGPDGLSMAVEGDTGLVHLAMHTTPESMREKQPVCHLPRRLSLVADARIDNRVELIAQLGRSRLPPGPSDGDLILHAYLRWREHAPEHLAGDFAFVIRDPSRQTVFCARDRLGVKPFYYCRCGNLFAFATELKALLALAEVPRDLDECWIADFLSGLQEDRENTPFEAVRRLAPAHALVVGSDRFASRRYWALDPESVLPHRSDEAFAEEYRERLFQAVAARMRRVGPPASMLSGGLDSSSIVCAARRLLRGEGEAVHAFSNIFDATPECDERPYIEAVLREGGVVPHFVHADDVAIIPDPPTFFRAFDVPPYARNVGLNIGLYRDASAAGVRVLLDGLYGDTCVSWGTQRLAELRRGGHWVELSRSIPQHARNVGLPRGLAFRAYLWWGIRHDFLRPLVPAPLVRAWDRRHAAGREPVLTLLRPEVAARIGFAERRRELLRVFAHPIRTARDAHYVELSSGMGVVAVEMLDPIAAAYGIEPRYPFMDHHLVEYCLALPSAQRFHRGWTRMVVRRALAGVLPEEVRWRGDKASLRAWYDRALRAALSNDWTERVGAAEAYLDRSVLRQAYNRYTASEHAASGLLLWQGFMLARWLERISRFGTAPGEKGGDRNTGPLGGAIEQREANAFRERIVLRR